MPVTALQAQVVSLEQECKRAQGSIQELLESGQTLQDKYLELQRLQASQEIQSDRQLKVAQMEIEGLKNQVNMESEF